jgi:hypothetical protein
MKNPKVLKTQVYEGYTLQMLDDWTIRVPQIKDDDAPDYDPPNVFKSVAEAKEAVLDDIKVKAAHARRVLNIVLLNDEDELVTVKGVHARNLKLLADRPTNRHDDLYPNVPWIAEAIRETMRLQAEAERYRQAVEPFKIKSPDGYDREEKQKPHHQLVDEFEARVATRTKAANKTTLKAALAKVKPDGVKPRRKLRL